MKAIFSIILLFFTGTISVAQHVNPSVWTYEKYPELPFNLDHLTLDISVDPEVPMITGVASYQISARQSGLAQILFHTSDLDINSIVSNDEALDFTVSNDSLMITLQDTLEIGQGVTFNITWQSESPYAIQQDEHGNIWTSLNPKTTHHWLPVFVHPRVQTTIEASFTIPANANIIFNGTLQDEEIISTNKRKVNWMINEPVPVTGLSWATGNFLKSEAIAGIKKITVWGDEQLLTNAEREALLQAAVRELKSAERTLLQEYPRRALQVVVLPDHYWNEIHYGPGIIYLYKNLGSYTAQLKRALAAQWFGAYHIYTDEIQRADDYEFLRLSSLPDLNPEPLLNPDSLVSVTAFNKRLQDFNNVKSLPMAEQVQHSVQELIQMYEGVLSWDDYASFWYELTGRYLDSIPQFRNEQVKESSFVYEVYYVHDESDNSLNLHFKAQEGREAKSLLDIEIRQFGFFDTTVVSESITGAEDDVVLDLAEDVEYVTIKSDTTTDVRFIEYKPMMFLIRQLQSSDVRERVEAAKGLKVFDDNPDLQLALNDAIQQEEHAGVRAEIIKTMAELTKGAKGTELTFLNFMRSENPAVKEAAISALSNYPGNQEVIFALRTYIMNSEADSVLKTAVGSYSNIADSADFVAFSQQIFERDSGGMKSLAVLPFALSMDTTEAVSGWAVKFLNSRNAYAQKKKVLNILSKSSLNEEKWREVIMNLIRDRDPRMRFNAAQLLVKLDEETASEIFSSRLAEEYDPRVAALLKRYSSEFE